MGRTSAAAGGPISSLPSGISPSVTRPLPSGSASPAFDAGSVSTGPAPVKRSESFPFGADSCRRESPCSDVVVTFPHAKHGDPLMDRIQARPLRPWERQKLQRLKRQLRNQVNSRHARIVLLSRGGVRNREIARLVDCSPAWVRTILHRFNDDGIEGIVSYPYFRAPRGPRKFPAELTEQIAEIALSPPRVLVGMNQWSLAKLRQYLVEQQVLGDISLSWLREVLRQRGIRWRHTKTWKDSEDAEFWPKYRRIRRLYRKRPAGGRRLCLDELGPLNLQPCGGHCLARDGKVQRFRATYSRHDGVRHMFGLYDLETDRLYGSFAGHKTSVQFLAFLQWVRRRYRADEVLHIVLDNYKPHLKAEVLQYAAAHNIRFYFTPTNASWLNRIECQFTALKKFALESSDFRSHPEQEEAIQSYLTWRNGRRPISLVAWRTFRRQQRRRAA
jgi:transposase